MPTPTSVFDPALAQMSAAGLSVFGPTGFRDYLDKHSLSASRTAEHISVSHFDGLPAALKASNTMVLRLGTGEHRRTNFALVRVADIHDFFLGVTPEAPRTFLSDARMRDLIGYTLLVPSETTLVNLAFTSGLIARALGLDDDQSLPAPARGVVRATFTFRSHSTLDCILEHVHGQVEIDALFVGRRNGFDHLFVLEAKQSGAALANHKLLYPVMALAGSVPPDMPIVPVYLRAERQPTGYLFTVAECRCPDPRHGLLALDAIEVKRSQAFNLPLGMASAP
jgi:hypothetical protein